MTSLNHPNSELDAIRFSIKHRIYDNALLLCQDIFARKPSQQIFYYYAKAYLESGSPIQAAILCQQYPVFVNPVPKTRLLFAQALFECGKFAESEASLKPLIQNQDSSVSDDIKTAAQYLLGMIKLRTHRHSQAQNDFLSAMQNQPLLISALLHIHNDIAPQIQQNPSSTNQKSLNPHELRNQKMINGLMSSHPSFNTSINQSINQTGNYSLNLSISSSSKLASKVSYRRNLKGPLIPTVTLIKSKNPSNTIDEMSPESKDSIFALKTKAIIYFRSSKYQESAKVFSRLFQLHPHTVEGLDIYSTTLWQLKDEKKLSLLAHKGIEIAPNHPEPWIALGNLFSLQHNSEEAIKMFNRAASIDHTCSYALALAGHEKLVFEALNDASQLFRQSIDRNPNEWSAWYGLGSVYFQQDNFGPAEYYMKKALDLNPSSSILHYVYGLILKKCGRFEEALNAFNETLKIEPMNLVAEYQKGVLLREMDDQAGALECLRKAETLGPKEPGVAFIRAQISQDLGQCEESLEWYTKAMIYGYPDTKQIHKATETIVQEMIHSILGQDESKESL